MVSGDGADLPTIEMPEKPDDKPEADGVATGTAAFVDDQSITNHETLVTKDSVS